MITSPIVQSLLIVFVAMPLVWAFVRYVALPAHRWLDGGEISPIRYRTVKGGEYFLQVMLAAAAVINVVRNI